MIAAMKADDTDVVVDMMYTPIVESVGGRDVMRKVAKLGMQKMSNLGCKIVSIETVRPTVALVHQ